MRTLILMILTLAATAAWARADVADQLLDRYRSNGGRNFSAAAGEAAWRRMVPDPKGGEARSCGTCHGYDLRQAGKHATTGKRIEAMAPSVNAERLSDAAKVEKWFLRNCKWAWGRECTAQEKGDFLMFIKSQ